ncbi:hypothetical protein Y032_0085g1839 [Ancylostoma ceylanicum]|uniref:Mos1 transposase HTH domain-containing protein n=1 Tax=Ancylostoma ceylanicum TaxID=53326 RepID=A0A016TR00_9BILA|nr:hypothetical protein Y032_0085g1839 [Ancylostoma ceylanicum]
MIGKKTKNLEAKHVLLQKFSWHCLICCVLPSRPLHSRAASGFPTAVSRDDEALRAAVESKPDTTTQVLAANFDVHHTTVVKHLASIGMFGGVVRVLSTIASCNLVSPLQQSPIVVNWI